MPSPIKPLYFISSDDPILLKHAYTQHLPTFQAAQFNDHERYTIDQDASIDTLTASLTVYDLFAHKKIIHITNPHTTFSSRLIALLTQYLEHPQAHWILWITCARLSKAQQAHTWLATIKKKGLFSVLYTPQGTAHARYVTQQLKERRIILSSAQEKLLARYTEGNLIALENSLLLLEMRYQNEAVPESVISSLLEDYALFSVFELKTQLEKKDITSARRSLHILWRRDTEPTLLLWAFSAAFRTLIQQHPQTIAFYDGLQACAALDIRIKTGERGETIQQRCEQLLTLFSREIS